jgi:hypothetical protein
VFQLYSSNKDGQTVFGEWLSRLAFKSFTVNLFPCQVGLEVCIVSNAGVGLRAFGDDVRLMSPKIHESLR